MKTQIAKKELREFGILIGICFPIFVGFIFPFFTGHFLKLWTLWIGIIFLIIAILKPRLLFYPYKIWMKIGDVLGWFNSRLILGLVFILILQPISLLMKFK